MGFISHIIFFIFLVVLVGGAATFFLTRRMARPLKQLQQVMARVGEGDLKSRFYPDKWGFEMNDVGADFNRTVEALLLSLERTKQQELARKLFENELKMGHEIQKSLFPTALPKIAHLDFAAQSLPSKEISGDFYDLFVCKNEKLLIALADVSGKGVSACLYALLFRSMLRAFSLKENHLHEIIYHANSLFTLDTADSGYFMTAWIGLYDPKTHQLEYGCMGHPPALLKRRDGAIVELGNGSGALGVRELRQLNIQTSSFMPGDLLLLYTDGVIEACNAREQPYGKERLLSHLMANASENPQELAERVRKEVISLSKENLLQDDLTLLLIKNRI